jgi:hypothetical protein
VAKLQSWHAAAVAKPDRKTAFDRALADARREGDTLEGYRAAITSLRAAAHLAMNPAERETVTEVARHVQGKRKELERAWKERFVSDLNRYQVACADVDRGNVRELERLIAEGHELTERSDIPSDLSQPASELVANLQSWHVAAVAERDRKTAFERALADARRRGDTLEGHQEAIALLREAEHLAMNAAERKAVTEVATHVESMQKELEGVWTEQFVSDLNRYQVACAGVDRGNVPELDRLIAEGHELKGRSRIPPELSQPVSELVANLQSWHVAAVAERDRKTAFERALADARRKGNSLEGYQDALTLLREAKRLAINAAEQEAVAELASRVESKKEHAQFASDLRRYEAACADVDRRNVRELERLIAEGTELRGRSHVPPELSGPVSEQVAQLRSWHAAAIARQSLVSVAAWVALVTILSGLALFCSWRSGLLHVLLGYTGARGGLVVKSMPPWVRVLLKGREHAQGSLLRIGLLRKRRIVIGARSVSHSEGDEPDLVIERDPSVRSPHAVIYNRGKKHWIQALGPVFIADEHGSHLSVEETERLYDRDVIRIGMVDFTFHNRGDVTRGGKSSANTGERQGLGPPLDT